MEIDSNSDALVSLGLQSWDDPSLDLAVAASRRAMAGYGAGGVLIPVVGAMADTRLTCYARSSLFSEFEVGPVDVPGWLRKPVC